MLICCTICHREYVATKKSTDEHFICSRCHGRTREQDAARLGLHPALWRKWANNQQDSIYDGQQGALTKPQKSAKLSDPNGFPRIPGFEISYQVGRGAMGSVYCARQIKTGRLVAIKVLASDLSDRIDLVARFEREAYALKSFADPNVVSVIDAGHINDIHYFVMEFIDGITLRTRLSQTPIDVREACYITSQILNGLRAAHDHGIIHRDLKPENVLLAYENRDFQKLPVRVVLVDFGLVGIGDFAFDPHPNLTRSKVTMGTVNYMAPEQHVDAKRVDHRSDLYSTGVIFFELLTKELPLGRYLLPYERNMNVPKEIDEILAKALTRHLSQRYASAAEFLADLQRLKFEPIEADAIAAVPRFKERILFHLAHGTKHARWALLLLLASLFFAVGVQLSKSRELPSAAQHKTLQRSQS